MSNGNKSKLNQSVELRRQAASLESQADWLRRRAVALEREHFAEVNARSKQERIADGAKASALVFE